MSQKTDNIDRQLIADCISNDRTAQAKFYKKYASIGLGVCLRYTNDRSEAMELLNGGMLKVFQKLSTFRWEGAIEGWIKRVVFSVVMDHFRRKKNVKIFEISDWDQPIREGVTAQLYAEDICQIIETLPGVSKEVFWLHAVEGYSHAEIGEKLSLSAVNSRWHLNRARKLLKQLLERESLKNNKYAG